MNDEPCKYHSELIKHILNHSAGLKEMREDMAEVKGVVNRINDTLIGTLEKQGLIGKLSLTDDQNRAAIDDLMEWREEINNLAKALFMKILGVGVGAVVVGAVISVAVVKYLGAF